MSTRSINWASRASRTGAPRTARLWLARVGAGAMAFLCLGGLRMAPDAQTRVGGCQTTTREYGLQTVSDSVARGALDELLRPGSGSKPGPHCRVIEVDAPLFFTIGAVEEGLHEHWVSLARQVTDCLTESGLHLADRSLLQYTTGTCFPPFHIDFRAVGDTAAVDSLLDRFATLDWDGFVGVPDRQARTHFLAAGRSLQLTEVVSDLRAVD